MQAPERRSCATRWAEPWLTGSPKGGSELDLSSRTAQLCMAGTQAEFDRRLDDARDLFSQAWDAATDDYEASMAAHYVAHLEPDEAAALEWDLEALRRARLDERTSEFLPSLYVSLGGSYERIGDAAHAREYFDLAAALGLVHQPE
jgi:lipopolysaccharide biosynthesis regulator YciM